MVKTTKGYVRRECFGDGRIKGSTWVDKEIGLKNKKKVK